MGNPGAQNAPTPQTGALQPGTQFGQYLITRHIGSGGMAEVYEAQHTGLKKRVALKTLTAQFAHHPEIRARFIREGEAAARIRHPNIVDITDIGIHENVPYLVMEFLRGEDLRGILERDGRLSERRTADIMVPVVAAVAAAHESNVIHRDVKPENIFLAQAPSGDVLPKVLDFGISKLANAEGQAPNFQLTGVTSFLGSPAYMSPEQARDFANVDARGDQYSIGVVMYECVTGQLPFMAPSLFEILQAITSGVFLHPRERTEAVSPEFEQVILRAMALKPNDRYATLIELGRALVPFASRRVRVVWERVFGIHSPDSVPPPGNKRNSDRPTLSPPPPVAHATIPADSENTTPIHAAALHGELAGALADVLEPETEADPEPTLRTLGMSRRPVWIGIAAAIVGAAAIAGGVIVATGGSDEPEGIAAPTPIPGPAPETAPLPSSLPSPLPSSLPALGTDPAPLPATFALTITATPPEARIELDGEEIGRGAATREVTRDGSEHTLRISAPGFVSHELVFRDEAPATTDFVLTPDEGPGERPTAMRAAEPRDRRAARDRTTMTETAAMSGGTTMTTAGVNNAPILD